MAEGVWESTIKKKKKNGRGCRSEVTHRDYNKKKEERIPKNGNEIRCKNATKESWPFQETSTDKGGRHGQSKKAPGGLTRGNDKTSTGPPGDSRKRKGLGPAGEKRPCRRFSSLSRIKRGKNVRSGEEYPALAAQSKA